MALARANDFLRAYLDDLDRGETRSLEQYVGMHPECADVLPRLWQELHDRAATSSLEQPDAAAISRLSAVGSDLSACPSSIAELVEQTFHEIERHDLGPNAPTATVDIPGYRLFEEIGRGGQGSVFRAHDEKLDRQVAVKVLPRGAMPGELDRLRREGQIAARLDDPCICKAYEVGDCDAGTFVAMQFVAGESLRTRIGASTSPPVELGTAAPGANARERVLVLVERMARAVHHMHEEGVLHRDIKPSNVIVAEDGRPVVLDLGLARMQDDATLTRADAIVGTLDYLAPELLDTGNATQDARTEVWALGVLLFECLTLQRPFRAATRAGLAEAIRRGQLPPEPMRRWPRDLRIVLETALDPDRDRRYASAAAFADDVERLIHHESVLARSIGPMLRLRRWVQRRPATATALVFAIALPSVWAIQANASERRTASYLAEALGAVETLLVQLAAVDLDDMPRGAALRTYLLEDAAQRYRRLATESRLREDVGLGLARVEIELARLAMETEDLVAATDYVNSARTRLAAGLDSRTPDPTLLGHATLAVARHAALLVRQGASNAANVELSEFEDRFGRALTGPEMLAPRLQLQLVTADVHRALGDYALAHAALTAAAASAAALGPRADVTLAVIRLQQYELHDIAGDTDRRFAALVAAEDAAQRAFLAEPSNRHVISLYVLTNFFRADRRYGRNQGAFERASLTRAKTLLDELQVTYPHWTQVRRMRWLYHLRHLRPLVRHRRAHYRPAIATALDDVRSYGDPASMPRETLLGAAALLRQLDDTVRAASFEHTTLARLAATFTEQVEARYPEIAPGRLWREATWRSFVSLVEPIRAETLPVSDPVSPSAAVARAVSSGMRQSGDTARKEHGDDELALANFRSAHEVMEQAYARDRSRVTRRFYYYGMTAHARQLARMGRWRESLRLTERGHPHFVYEAGERDSNSVVQFWERYGPMTTLEHAQAGVDAIPVEDRVRWAKAAARVVRHLETDERLPILDKARIREAYRRVGRGLLDAAVAGGWEPPQPHEMPLLGRLLD